VIREQLVAPSPQHKPKGKPKCRLSEYEFPISVPAYDNETTVHVTIHLKLESHLARKLTLCRCEPNPSQRSFTKHVTASIGDEEDDDEDTGTRNRSRWQLHSIRLPTPPVPSSFPLASSTRSSCSVVIGEAKATRHHHHRHRSDHRYVPTSKAPSSTLSTSLTTRRARWCSSVTLTRARV
jgi:hypothetical protein